MKYLQETILKIKIKPGIVAHSFNPSTKDRQFSVCLNLEASQVDRRGSSRKNKQAKKKKISEVAHVNS